MDLVYIMYIPNTLYKKIGKSDDTSSRIGSLQTANPLKIMIYDSFPCRDALAIENLAKKKFKDNNIRGEWFSFDDDQLEVAIEFICNAILEMDAKLDTNTCEICNFSANDDKKFAKHISSPKHNYRVEFCQNGGVVTNETYKNKKAIQQENANLKLKIKETEKRITIINNIIENTTNRITRQRMRGFEFLEFDDKIVELLSKV